MRFSGCAVSLALVLLAGPARAQGSAAVEAHLEAGALLSSLDPGTAAAERIRDWPYGLRLAGSVADGVWVANGEVATLFFREDREDEADRYRTSAKFLSLAAGLRTPPLHLGRYGLRAGANVGTTWLSASRALKGRPAPILAPAPGAAEAVPEPRIRSGFFVEPRIQIQGREIGFVARYRVYDGTSSLQQMLLVGWSIQVRGAEPR